MAVDATGGGSGSGLGSQAPTPAGNRDENNVPATLRGSLDGSLDRRSSMGSIPEMGRPILLEGRTQRHGNVSFGGLSASAPPRSVKVAAGVGPASRNFGGFGGGALRSSFRTTRFPVGGVSFRNPAGGEDSMSAFDFDPTDTVEEDVPLDLHAACRFCESLKELRIIFRAVVNEMGAHEACSAEEASGGGRLPLHCIGINREILLTCTGGRSSWGQIEKFILSELIPAHSVAVTEEDDKGRIPFTEAIYDWVRGRRAIRLWRATAANKKTSLQKIADKLVEKTLSGISNKTLDSSESRQLSSSGDDDSSLGSIHSDHSEHKLATNQTGHSHPCEATRSLVEEHEEGDDNMSSDLAPLVEFSLRLLSSIIDRPPALSRRKKKIGDDDETVDDEGTSASSAGGSFALGGPTQRRSVARRRYTVMSFGDALDSFYSEVVVEKVAAIPNLIQELLLIEDKAARSRVFDMSVVRRALLCKKSFGSGEWLNRMLIKGAEGVDSFKRKPNLDGSARSSIHMSAHSGASIATAVTGVPDPRDYAEGAVYYLECISGLSPWDLASPGARAKKKIKAVEIDSFRKQRDELFSAVGGMDNLITDMIVLDDDLIDRVAVTSVVQRALDEVMSLPMATTMTFLDIICHTLLIISFRAGPCRAMFNIAAANEKFNPHSYILWWIVLLLVCSYFCYRKINQMIAKYYVSQKLFLADLRGNFWTRVDLFSLLAVVSASIAIDRSIRYPPGWVGEEDAHIQYLRFWAASATGLVWLKLMGHIKMLNKHLATFVLCSMEIMKDIKFFLIVLTITLAAFAQMFVSMMHGTQPGESEHSSYHIYFKAYGIMLGDFDTTHFSSGFLSLLFVLYTFIVTIVLLNILIAIVSSSYDRSMVSSETLFGKARVQFVADLMSIHTIYELIESGKLNRRFRSILLLIETVFAASCAIMALTTVRARAGNSIQQLTIPFEVEVAAFFGAFLFFGSILFKLRLLSYMHSMELFSRKVGKKRSKAMMSTTDWLTQCIFKIQALVIKYLDYANDNSDLEMRALMHSSEDEELAAEVKHASGLNRTIIHLKKQIKAESQQCTEKLSSEFHASEERFQQEMNDLEERLLMFMAESEERIASVLSPPSEEQIAQAVTRALRQIQGNAHLNGDSQVNRAQTEELQGEEE